MKRILKTLRKKWPEYVIEAVVIIASILGAYALDNWNEDRKERALERKYLKALLVDLDRDLISLEKLESSRQQASEAAYKLLSSEGIAPTYEALKEFSEDWILAHFWIEFVPNDNTFKELANSGQLSLFENDSVKIGLLNIESLNDEIITARNHMRREFDIYLYDELIKYEELPLLDFQHMITKKKMDLKFFTSIDHSKLIQAVSQSNEIIKNPTIRNGWRLAILNSAFIIDLYSRMSQEIKNTKKHIKKSLDS